MREYLGIPITKGTAIGYAYRVIPKRREYAKRKIELSQIESEIGRFDVLIKKAEKHLQETIDGISIDKQIKEILFFQIEILKDPTLKENVSCLIREELVCLENAIIKHFLQVKQIFSNIKNPYLNQRSADFEGVANKLLEILDGDKNSFDSVKANSILFVEDLTPSDVVNLSHKKIGGLCTERGGKTAHAYIIIKSIGIKTIIDVEDILSNVKDNDLVILDSTDGRLIVSPDEPTLKKFQKKLKKEQLEAELLKKIVSLPSRTKDGKQVEIVANIELPQEITPAMENGAAGVGLLRTEFLYMDRSSIPTEEEQFSIYKSLVEQVRPHPLTIRTIDVGGDKTIDFLDIDTQENPNLGLRGVRVSLFDQSIFKVQLKAILRASFFGDVRVLFPMVSTIWEIKKIKSILKECMGELEKNGERFNNNIKIGIMIEIPSTVFLAETFACECDFFSLGTNDLIQYLFAIDRNNERVQHYFNHQHPLVFQIVEKVVLAAHKQGLKVAVCGELASEEQCVDRLIDIGVDELSVNPSAVLTIKNIVINHRSKNGKV